MSPNVESSGAETAAAPAAPALPPSLGDQHASLFAIVTDALRRKILDGEYQQGDRLVEGRISEQLGVSRIPVREALRALQSEGLVRIEPRRGATVASVSDRLAQELVEVRATLESLNARLSAQRRDTSMVERLRCLLDTGRQAAARNDVDALVAVNAQVHDLVAEGASNEVLADMTRSLRDRTALLFAPINRGRALQNWYDHAQILEAIAAGDAELAALLAARHVNNAATAYEAAHAAALGASAA
ncbi:FCD domain-containing protein [Xylophilus rhododendri]|uniref:FCD domain-containing protein n=1 Tax=Xylophilus rhododendri TaxID=2697032 RepID=A0A857J6E6_9BURK|nr:GntR family transcriptional regulator [Xylophilus rhododendri]QHI98591.1 FCD domain-containing protein [Xylophilus rhododendri]